MKSVRVATIVSLTSALVLGFASPGWAQDGRSRQVGTKEAAQAGLCGENGPTPNGVIGAIYTPGAQPYEYDGDGWGYINQTLVHCDSDEGPLRWGVSKDGAQHQTYCLRAGESAVLPGDSPVWAPTPYVPPSMPRRITHISAPYSCSPGDPVEPPAIPWVEITGTVRTKVNLGGPERAVDGAFFELVYKGRAGSLTDEVRWRPVLSGVDEQGLPAGNAVTGYLSDGRYRVRFPYPHERTYGNGAIWHGCERPAVVVPFLGSFACDPPGTPGTEPPAASESALQLRVYAKNRTDSVHVFDYETEEVELIESIDLGLFFQRTRAQETTMALTPAAFSYGAALTMKESWHRPEPDINIYLNDDGHTFYDPDTTSIMIDRSDMGTTHEEHEIAHLFADQSLYEEPPPTADGCQNHGILNASTTSCAWQEGLASFIALVAEHRYTGVPIYEGNAFYRFNLEDCYMYTISGGVGSRCETGSKVEGRVTALLWDLYDGPAVEQRNGFKDEIQLPYDDVILAHINNTRATQTVDEFMSTWPTLSRDRPLMFQNTLSLYEIRGERAGRDDEGGWASIVCPACHDRSYARSAAGRDAVMRWNLSEVNYTGRYEIWVRLPQGDPGLDTAATYSIPTTTGVVSVSVDHAAAVDGWINLDPRGFRLQERDNVVIELRNNSSPAKELAADALVLAPLMGAPVR